MSPPKAHQARAVTQETSHKDFHECTLSWCDMNNTYKTT